MQIALLICTLKIYNKCMKSKYSKSYLIETGIGLQAVDGLSNSTYFKTNAKKYIKGEISIDELENIITSYYKHKKDVEDRSDEADMVATRITKLINDDSFSFSIGQLLSIHEYLFKGIVKDNGKLRKYNISKNEWVLNGKSVIYADYRDLKQILIYDFAREEDFDYQNLNINEIIEHLASFISNLWQIHAFEEGNTRTTAVFLIKYLRTLGFDATNDAFSKNAYYFRNALVRANYNDLVNGVFEDKSFLIKFLRNLLLNEKNKLNSKDMNIKQIKKYDISDRESNLIALIKKNPKITAVELSKELGCSTRTIKSVLSILQDKNIIVRKNGKKNGYWQIV